MRRLTTSVWCFWACLTATLAYSVTLPGAAVVGVAGVASNQPTLEEELLLFVNQYRAEKGAPRLLIDDVLVGQAREQSQRMAAAGVVSHDLPDSGNLKTRLANAGYSFRTVSENLARAGTVADAHDALITSPGHLRNLLSMDVTHVGIGVVRGAEPSRQDLYVTQIFADPALLAPPETVREQFLARVEQSRSRSGLDPLPVDPVFIDAAMHTLLEMDGSIERDALRNLMADAVQNLRQARPTLRAPSRVAVDVQLLHDTREMKVPGHLLRQDATAFGAAAFEGRDSRNLPAVVLLSLICLD